MKLLFNNTKVLIAAFVLFFAINTSGVAQCKSVVNEGITKLAPFTFNGQLNLIPIKEGNPAEIYLSFYKGYYYKIQISYEYVFNGSVSFEVFTENKKLVFNSNEGGDKRIDSWTFYSNSSQNLIFKISTTSKIKMHCVPVLVGVQIPKNNHPMRYL